MSEDWQIKKTVVLKSDEVFLPKQNNNTKVQEPPSAGNTALLEGTYKCFLE